jgi:ABC-type cobalamin/Fe3+-siderophores transport system ATPase subunit
MAAGRIVREGAPIEVIRPELIAAVFGTGLEVVTRDGHPAVLPRVATRRS